jgi:hypothetical protein
LDALRHRRLLVRLKEQYGEILLRFGLLKGLSMLIATEDWLFARQRKFGDENSLSRPMNRQMAYRMPVIKLPPAWICSSAPFDAAPNDKGNAAMQSTDRHAMSELGERARQIGDTAVGFKFDDAG